ncbi:MAG TPA: outer membrane beta-barrel protein [Gammaproteobacteria bacterium]|jgi:hypothetical protein
MKLTILRLALALAAFTVVPNAWAADSDTGNIFVDAAYGKTTGGQASTGDTGFTYGPQSAWHAGGGYRWKLDDARSLGFEVGYMHFGIIADNSDANGFVSGATSATAMTAGANFRCLFGDDEAWIFQGRVGVMTVKFTENYSSFIPDQPTMAGSSSSRQGGVYFGAGIGRDITRNLSLILAYEIYSSGDSGNSSGEYLGQGFVGLGAEYRF